MRRKFYLAAAGIAFGLAAAGGSTALQAQDTMPPMSQDTSNAAKTRADTMRADTTRGYRASVDTAATCDCSVAMQDSIRVLQDRIRMLDTTGMVRDSLGVMRDSTGALWINSAPTDTIQAKSIPGMMGEPAGSPIVAPKAAQEDRIEDRKDARAKAKADVNASAKVGTKADSAKWAKSDSTRTSKADSTTRRNP